MKKLIPTIFSIALVWILFLINPSFVLAACDPPNDYTDCPGISQTGPKIAGNIDPSNYAQIRQEYNAANPSVVNQWIPVTIIYNVQELQGEHAGKVLENLQAMQASGLMPIVRIWDSTDADDNFTAAQTLNGAFAQTSFPRQIVYPFNEPNLPEAFQNNPDAFAEAMSAFIQGAGDNPNYQIYLAPMAGHQAGAEYAFALAALTFQMPDGSTIAAHLDGAALTIYAENPGQFQNLFNQWANLLAGQGIHNLMISELGPFPIMQSQADIPAWIAAMSEVFRQIKQEGLLSGAEFINTSFFLDLDGDGFPDVTLLVVIHADGTVEIIDLLAYDGNWAWAPGWGQPPDLECKPDQPGDHDSRPVECDACNLTDKLTPACATSATVNDYAFYQRKESEKVCDGEHWVEKTWKGDITVNPSDTKIPFVGKKDNENVDLYLADYLDGTTEYYEDQNYPLYWLDGVNNVGVWRKLTPSVYQDQLKKDLIKRAQETSGSNLEEGGLHDYKVRYVGRFCWNAPVWAQILLSIPGMFPDVFPDFLGFDPLDPIRNAWKLADRCFYAENIIGSAVAGGLEALFLTSPIPINHRLLDKETDRLTALAGHLPPDPREMGLLEYNAEYRKWLNARNGRWAKLWSVTPMFTREDTYGFVTPYVGQKLLDSVFYKTPQNMIEKVPHVARLYEVSQALQQMLFPYYKARYSAPAPTPTPEPIAQESTDLSSEVAGWNEVEAMTPARWGGIHRNLWSLWEGFQNKKTTVSSTYLAQGGNPSGSCLTMDVNAGFDPDNSEVHVTVVYKKAGDFGGVHFQPLVNGSLATGNAELAHPIFTLVPPWSRTPVKISPGQTISITYGYLAYPCAVSDVNTSETVNCEFRLSDSGEFTTNCGGPTFDPPDICIDPLSANPVNSCSGTGLTDSNPNDDLCCEPIEIALRGVDRFVNEEYCECGFCENDPDHNGCMECFDEWDPVLGQFVEKRIEHCEDCATPEPVSRETGVGLSHPYLEEIWEQMSKNETNGVFNFLRPAEINPFEDIDAKDNITYGYKGDRPPPWSDCQDPEYSINPAGGEFFFPHLGGVQLAREWITNAVKPNSEKVTLFDILLGK